MNYSTIRHDLKGHGGGLAAGARLAHWTGNSKARNGVIHPFPRAESRPSACPTKPSDALLEDFGAALSANVITALHLSDRDVVAFRGSTSSASASSAGGR